MSKSAELVHLIINTRSVDRDRLNKILWFCDVEICRLMQLPVKYREHGIYGMKYKMSVVGPWTDSNRSISELREEGKVAHGSYSCFKSLCDFERMYLSIFEMALVTTLTKHLCSFPETKVRPKRSIDMNRAECMWRYIPINAELPIRGDVVTTAFGYPENIIERAAKVYAVVERVGMPIDVTPEMMTDVLTGVEGLDHQPNLLYCGDSGLSPSDVSDAVEKQLEKGNLVHDKTNRL